MLTIDYANCLKDRVGPHGLDAQVLTDGTPLADAAARFTRSLEDSRGTGWERWRTLADDPVRSEHMSAVQSVAGVVDQRFRAGEIDNLVVLGIGGSALGNIALQAALNPATWNLIPREQRSGPRHFVLDNVDPSAFNSVMALCAPERTVFNVISKSGETAETAAQFMIIRDLLASRLGDRARDHVVAITDPQQGTMRRICDEAGYATLPVPDGVGGRFSVLSPVGLFSAACCGVDIRALLAGAAEMDARCRRERLLDNPAATLATLLVELGRAGKPNHVLMPYANGLYLLADWFRQLWAESLGKRHDTAGNEVFAGFTPIKALGATDQHSQVQLYREGPNDKVFGFMRVADFGSDVDIPGGLGVENLRYLEHKRMSKLLNAEQRATEYALVESQRPNFTIRFERIDAHAVGEFIMLWQVATAYAGLMLGIDAYDQPAVETGKKATFGLMGREGFAEWQDRVDAALERTEHVIDH